MLTLRCPADKYESAISPPLPKPALTKEEVEDLSHIIIKEYLYSSNLKVRAKLASYVALRSSGIHKSFPRLPAEGAAVCEGAQQLLAAVRAGAEGH